MTAPSSGPRPGAGRPMLRAARQERGWSQTDAARELASLAARTGVAVAGPASLKTQLSRWENGHAAPDPEYRALLAALYDRDPAGLGLTGGDGPAGAEEPAGELSGALAEAGALDAPALALLREQLEATARLDHRLGPAGAADVLAIQVERLSTLADHALGRAGRQDLCALLAEASLLSGDLERDRARTGTSWARYGTARAAALEAGRPELAARARAARARLLLDRGEPDRARTLLHGETDDWSSLVRAEADAVAAPGTGPARGTRRRVPDAVRPGIAVDVAAIGHRRCLARAASGDGEARSALERAAGDERRPVRERAETSAALALALHGERRPVEALTHARRAQLTALRIGAPRIAALVADLLARGADPDGGRAQTSAAPARSSSAAR